MPAPPVKQKTETVEKVISTFQPTKLFKHAGVHYTSIDFDDSGELALLARTDDTLQLYNCKRGTHARKLRSEKYGCSLARFHHDARFIIYASTKIDPAMSKTQQHALRYHNTETENYVHYFTGHTDRVTCLSVCPGSDTLLSASLDNTVKLWDARTPNVQGNLNLYGATLTAYDPSATVLAVASPATQSILLYDLKNFDKPPFATFDMLEIERSYRDRQPAGAWTSLEFSNDGKYLLVGTGTGAGHYLLDAFDGVLKAFLERPRGAPPFPAEVSTNLGAKDGQKDHAPAGLQGGCCFSPDGRYVLSAHRGTGLVVWDTTGSEGGSAATDGGKNAALRPMCELASKQTATVVGYNPKHNMLVSAGSAVTLWLPDPDVQ